MQGRPRVSSRVARYSVVKVTEKISGRASIMGELIVFLWERKLWWMIPMVTVLVLMVAYFLPAVIYYFYMHTVPFWPDCRRRAWKFAPKK